MASSSWALFTPFHLVDLALYRQCRGSQSALAAELSCREYREEPSEAHAYVARVDGRFEAVAGVGEEEEQQIFIGGE
jgi:hypothetical protein